MGSTAVHDLQEEFYQIYKVYFGPFPKGVEGRRRGKRVADGVIRTSLGRGKKGQREVVTTKIVFEAQVTRLPSEEPSLHMALAAKYSNTENQTHP